MKLYRTYKDKNFVYFLISFINGVELFDAIRQIDLLNNKQASFYIGSMIVQMEYLHTQKIVYRDIKPENIMVHGKTGIIYLIDLGTAKVLSSKSGLVKTYTILGTPHYMAPEIL